MDVSQHVHLKLIGDVGFIGQVKRFAEQDPENLKVESETKDDDPTRLGFDLATVSAVVVFLEGGPLVGGVGAEAFKWVGPPSAGKGGDHDPRSPFELFQ